MASSQDKPVGVPAANMPADDYVPDEDDENYEMEADEPAADGQAA